MTNIRKLASAFIVLMALSLGSYARETVAIVDHKDVAVITGSGKPITTEQVRDAITAAATSLRWEVSKSSSQDLLSATLIVRGKHTVAVSIPYSSEKYSVMYQSSINMKYGLAASTPESSDFGSTRSPGKGPAPGTPMIHPAYNKWVQDLLQSIQANLRKL